MKQTKFNDLIVESVAILIGNYSWNRKKAAYLILKGYLAKDFFNCLMQDDLVKNVVNSLKIQLM